MARKNDLLSIGDISKYTRISKYSLRYYERIGLLKPAFIDPDSGYRYYTFDQVYIIEIISLCIELGIPLKELTKFIDGEGTIDYSSLLEYGNDIAEQKLKTLQRSVKFIGAIKNRIAQTETYPQSGELYTREIQKKYYCVTPCKKPRKNAEPFQIIKASLDISYYEDNYDEWLYSELLEYGFLCKHSPVKAVYYMFAELPEHVAMNIKENIMIIPAGTYCCTRNKDSQIEQAAHVFHEHLKDKDLFLAIETDVFTSKYKINRPENELRVISLVEGI